jgi:hypothetical protein
VKRVNIQDTSIKKRKQTPGATNLSQGDQRTLLFTHCLHLRLQLSKFALQLIALHGQGGLQRALMSWIQFNRGINELMPSTLQRQMLDGENDKQTCRAELSCSAASDDLEVDSRRPFNDSNTDCKEQNKKLILSK